MYYSHWSMEVLVIGAGAVGQVYARHLQAAGASVAFYVKEKYAAETRAGLSVYPLNEKPRWEPKRFDGFDVLTTTEEVASRAWDQVWLCISSTALRGDWLEPMLAAIGDAVLVTLQPGPHERAYLLERFPVDRLVSGAIGFISFQSPLPGETREPPGVAYWFPPLSPSPFSGPEEHLGPLLAALKKGGCPAKASPDASRWAANPTAIMMPHLAALEADGWSLRALGRSGKLPLAAAASREAMTIIANHYESRPPFSRRFVRGWTMRFVLWLAPKLMPFDFEVYLRYHFTKVGDQTRYLMRSYSDMGRAAGLEVSSLRKLESIAFSDAT